jgi:cysteine desulfurase / selenocysteine lyase
VIRNDFPILSTLVKKKKLVYFDNAASTQKPKQVIDAISNYYLTQNSNIHRGAHYLANLATEAYENVRIKLANFIGAKPNEVIFTSGTTASINLLTQSWGRKFLNSSDNIVLTEMEHHANIVPWIALQSEIGFEIRYIPMDKDCQLDLNKIDSIIDSNTKLLSLAYVSNAIGTIHPIEKIISKAKSVNSLVHLDCAQAIQHQKINIDHLNVDFLSFSSHKMYGPMGIGVFWGKEELLNEMNPFLYGGEMIQDVFLDKVTYNKIPYKFEAGTPNVADVIGLGAAIDYIEAIGIEKIIEIETDLHRYFLEKIRSIPNVLCLTPDQSCSVVSFNVREIHAFDLGQLLDAKGIAVRTGTHCCQPLMRVLNIEGSCRASISFYNTKEEIDYFIQSLEETMAILL